MIHKSKVVRCCVLCILCSFEMSFHPRPIDYRASGSVFSEKFISYILIKAFKKRVLRHIASYPSLILYYSNYIIKFESFEILKELKEQTVPK